MAKHIRICPRCYDHTGDTFEFDATPPTDLTCDDCGSRLKPRGPVEEEHEGWLYARDYSERHEAL